MWDIAARCRAAMVALAAMVGLAVCAPFALADVEPNDFIYQAEGPIAGGANIAGNVAIPDAGDWYVLYLTGQQQMHLTSTGCPTVQLTDTNGTELTSDYTTPVGTTARYFVHVTSYTDWRNDCDSNLAQAYTFQVNPLAAVVAGPSAKLTVLATGEPNELAAQAQGPLLAGPLYTGTIDTSNDQDWFYFFTQPGTHQVDLAAYDSDTSIQDRYRCRQNLIAWDHDPLGLGNSSPIGTASTDEDGFIHHVTFTSTTAQAWYVNMSVNAEGCLHGRWLLRIESPDAIAESLPAPPVLATEMPEARTRYFTSVSLRRRGARYSGRVTSGQGCNAGRLVVLRRAGSTRSFGRTRTRASGTFAIQRRHRVRGSVGVHVAQRSLSTAICQAARSRRIRG